MDGSSSAIPQTHIFFVPNIKGLAQTVLTWEGKVFAAEDVDMDADSADAAKTDWKHKVTPERGGLIIIAYLYSTNLICVPRHNTQKRLVSWDIWDKCIVGFVSLFYY